MGADVYESEGDGMSIPQIKVLILVLQVIFALAAVGAFYKGLPVTSFMFGLACAVYGVLNLILKVEP